MFYSKMSFTATPIENKTNTILISSCLSGEKCAYDKKSRKTKVTGILCKDFKCIDVCPEIFGGLTSPRDVHEIVGGSGEDVLDGSARVFSKTGIDRTDVFINGAKKTLQLALENKVKAAVMKARSPSCGKGEIYDGRFANKLCKGNGVTTALLLRQGIPVFADEEIGTEYGMSLFLKLFQM